MKIQPRVCYLRVSHSRDMLMWDVYRIPVNQFGASCFTQCTMLSFTVCIMVKHMIVSVIFHQVTVDNESAVSVSMPKFDVLCCAKYFRYTKITDVAAPRLGGATNSPSCVYLTEDSYGRDRADVGCKSLLKHPFISLSYGS